MSASVNTALVQRRVARRPRVLDLLLFGELSLVVLAYNIYFILVRPIRGHLWDFVIFRNAGRRVIEGLSPYPAHATVALLHTRELFVYPPMASYLFAPFAALPLVVAAAVYFVAQLACLFGAIRLLQVRDWRCYTLPFLWLPMFHVLSAGAIGPLLTLLLAVCWRYRDERPLLAAGALALAIVAKLFLWPVAIWLLVTRRWRAAAWAFLFGAAVFLIPFAPLGWHAFAGYPHLLRMLDAALSASSYSTTALLHALGVSPIGATVLLVLAGLLLAAAAFRFGQRGNDAAPFVLAIEAALLLSPIVWTHYYILLLVPIAIARPRLSALWLAPLVFWVTPHLSSSGNVWLIAFAVSACISICGLATLSLMKRPASPPIEALASV